MTSFLKSSYGLNASRSRHCCPSERIFCLSVFPHKFNAFPTVTKHSALTETVTFAGWDVTAKPTQTSFPFYNFTGRKCVLTVDLSNLGIQFFSFFMKLRTSIFQLEKALCGFGLADPNRQDPYSCAWEP